MKKALLLSMCLAATASFAAETEQPKCITLDGVMATRTSPDGVWLAAASYPNLIIINLATDKRYEMYVDDPYSETNYRVSSGYCVANDGTVLGGRNMDEAGIWTPDGELGKWTLLPGTENVTAGGNSITSDGKYIVGFTANPDFVDVETTVASVPVVWTRNDDGTYSEPEFLPYPDKDWTDRTPTYCLGNAISEDGKVVVGLMIDYFGTAGQPFISKKGEDGKWTTKLLFSELLNPTGEKLPPFPGSIDFTNPTFTPQAYMSEENAAKYNEDFNNWVSSETPDPEKMPDPLNYMSEEEKGVYEKRCAEYLEWETAYQKYQDKMNEIANAQTSFAQNLIFMNPAGTHILATTQKADPDADPSSWMPSYLKGIMLYDIEKETYVESDGNVSLSACQLNDNLDILATNYNDINYVERAYIARDGKIKEIQPLEDYYKTTAPEIYDFMNENMIENVIVDMVENEDGEMLPVYDDVLISGNPCGPFDLKWLACGRINLNTDQDETFLLGWTKPVGVSGIEVSAFSLESVGNGNLKVNGNASEIRIFDLSGNIVFNGNGSGIISTNLSNGLYIVKAVSESGETVVIKTVI